MSPILIIPIVLNVLALIACGLALWVGQDNHKAPTLPQSRPRPFDAELTRFNQNSMFRFFDRIPLFRRSGKATVNDLGKALIIMLVISFLPGALMAPLLIDLWACAFLLSTVACILFMHPFLSHRQQFAQNVRGRSPFRR